MAAGVSTQTVSRVLNDHPNIRPDTRARVLAAISELGYRVNNAARSLGTSTTRTIGVIVSDASLHGPSTGLAALDAAARAAGRWIATAYADGADEASMLSAADRLLTQGVDGVVVLAPHAATLGALEVAHPNLAIAGLHAGAGAEHQAQGIGLAVEHLAHLGHRSIATLSGPRDWLESVARNRGFTEASRRLDLIPGPRWLGDWSAASGARSAPEIARAVREPGGLTAVVAANDQMALGLIAGLRLAGLDVPGDVSITGFDDNPDAAFFQPALTTVRLDLDGEARRVVASVLRSDEPPHPLPPTLVVRSSTRALA
jgi:DNA-binding LacI/PurR family transcriptional regulator